MDTAYWYVSNDDVEPYSPIVPDTQEEMTLAFDIAVESIAHNPDIYKRAQLRYEQQPVCNLYSSPNANRSSQGVSAVMWMGLLIVIAWNI